MTFPILFFVAIAMVIGWFIMMNRLHKILRTRHQDTYESLGQPTLFLNNSIKNGLLTSKFLFGRQYRKIQDSELRSLCNMMNVYFWIYLIVLVGAVVSIPFSEIAENQRAPHNKQMQNLVTNAVNSD